MCRTCKDKHPQAHGDVEQVTPWTCCSKIYHCSVYCSFTRHCWGGNFFFRKISATFFPWHVHTLPKRCFTFLLVCYIWEVLASQKSLRSCYKDLSIIAWAGIDQSIQRLATGWTVSGSNSGWEGAFFHTRSDRPWGRGPSSLLHNGYRVFFPGIKRPGRGVNNQPSSSAEVK